MIVLTEFDILHTFIPGSKAYSSLYQDKYFHNDENGNSITTNGGTDFVIIKIKIPKNEIKNYLPTLAEIIGTNEEKDWYLKLLDSNNNLAVSPNQTFYIGGYPSNYWLHTLNRLVVLLKLKIEL